MGDGPYKEGCFPNDPFRKQLFANFAGFFKIFSSFCEFSRSDFAF